MRLAIIAFLILHGAPMASAAANSHASKLAAALGTVDIIQAKCNRLYFARDYPYPYTDLEHDMIEKVHADFAAVFGGKRNDDKIIELSAKLRDDFDVLDAYHQMLRISYLI